MKFIAKPSTNQIIYWCIAFFINPLIYMWCYNYLKPKLGIDLPDLGYWEFVVLSIFCGIFRSWSYTDWEIKLQEEK